MNPDPNLVVEALRRIRNGKDYAPWSLDEGWGHRLKKKEMQVLAEDALPHAEAIAEMWPNILEETCCHMETEDPAVQELIAAAREHLEAEERAGWGQTPETVEAYVRLSKLTRAALKNLEEA